MSFAKISALLIGSSLLIASSKAQPAAGQLPPNANFKVVVGGAGGGGVGVPFGQTHRQEMLDALKDKLEMSDDDFKALSPKIEKLLDAKQNMSTGAGMGWSSMNGAKPTFKASESKVDTEPGRAMQDVREAAADKEKTDEEIAKKIAAVREAKEKANVEWEAAQKELIDSLTPRQQAVLMTLGVIE
jgi:hypothetical protein